MNARALVAEGVGTMLLLAAVVGSGIMGDTLSDGSVGLALLANSIATGLALAVLIFAFGPLSGAHFNPAVTLAFCLRGDTPWRLAPAYVAVQIAGGARAIEPRTPFHRHSASSHASVPRCPRWEQGVGRSGGGLI